ncbi:Na+/H+ antiporter subunit E [Corynebacterium tuscaniense]|uniref:Na+/H+ antiporter subunit E n=1 Tax=Corynebacterium tuscaniense TaxID=302449 RepID=UPI00123882EB|nr:Na+/H+ antiporter subunit E [Corynebacterium tuscaniense]KAA8730686.1 Na+/H+ antiporter subunit E [Corynebacterium tuscaniense]
MSPTQFTPRRSFGHNLTDRFRPWFIVWLTVMWILLMGEFTWANTVAGLLLGTVITMLLPLPKLPTSGIKVDVPKLFIFVVRWVGQLIVAAIHVSWLAIRPADPPRSAIFKVPMRLDSELALYFATCAYNLQPGGCVTDIDLANRTWTIHVLSAGTQKDVEKALADVKKLERSMIEIFEKRKGPKHG